MFLRLFALKPNEPLTSNNNHSWEILIFLQMKTLLNWRMFKVFICIKKNYKLGHSQTTNQNYYKCLHNSELEKTVQKHKKRFRGTPWKGAKKIWSPLSENYFIPHYFRPLYLGACFSYHFTLNYWVQSGKVYFYSLCKFNSLVVSIEIFNNLLFWSS